MNLTKTILALVALALCGTALAAGDHCVASTPAGKFKRTDGELKRVAGGGGACRANEVLEVCKDRLSKKCHVMHGKPWARKRPVYIGHTCPTTTQLKNVCGLDPDYSGYINYGSWYRDAGYRLYDNVGYKNKYYSGRCSGDPEGTYLDENGVEQPKAPVWPACPEAVYK